MPNQTDQRSDDFLIEKIKDRPLNKKKLIRQTLTTALMAVIFGSIACFTFLFLEPVFSGRLQPEESIQELPRPLNFPEDEEEMLPEEMLSEKLEANQATPEPEEVEAEKEAEVELSEEQVQELLGKVTLKRENLGQMYEALGEYVAELSRTMVTVTALESETDWFSNVYENASTTAGVLIANDDNSLLILAEGSTVRKGERLQVTFAEGSRADALILGYHAETGVCILSVPIEGLEEAIEQEKIGIAPLGASLSGKLLASPVIAMGMPMGRASGSGAGNRSMSQGGETSVGYGMLTSIGGQLSKRDGNFALLTTDIYGSTGASGILFDLNGRVLGLITAEKTGNDMRNMICAYGISGLKRLINILSSGKAIPYLGLKGMDVTKEANEEYGVPYGMYIREVAANSPVMTAGIRQGDIVVGFGEDEIRNMKDYSDHVMDAEAGEEITLKIMRLSQNEYREMEFAVTLSTLE